MAKWETRAIPITDTRPKWEKEAVLVSPERVRPLQRQLGAFRGAGATGEWGEKPTGLLSRLGKQFYNIAIAAPAHELGKADMDAAGVRAIELTKQWEKEQGIRLSDNLFDEQIKDWAGQLRQPSRARESDYLKKERRYAEEKPDVNPFAAYVSEAQTIKESAIDIIAGVAGFAAQLAVLRKAFPMAKPAVIWETQNLATGGNPGAGVAMYGAFTVPGKIIKGTTLIAKGGRLAAESVSLASLSAIEQKIDTGEIDPVQIGIAAALPLALRTPKAIKSLIRKRNPKVMNAIAVAHPEILRRLPAQRDIISGKLTPVFAPAAGGTAFRAGKIKEGLLHFGTKEAATKAAVGRKVNQYKLDIKKPATMIDSGRAHNVNPVALIEDIVAGKNPKLVSQLIPVIKHIQKTEGTKAAFDAIKKALKNHGYDGVKYTNINEAPGSISYIALSPKQVSSVKVVVPKPIKVIPTIDTANKTITDWSKVAKMLNKTERKAAVHKLRQRQAAISKERYKLERDAGTPRLLAARRARRASKGQRAKNPEIEPLKLTPEQQDLYGRRIEQIYPPEYEFQRTGASEAILKMTEGRIPTNYEFGLLEPIFGRDATKKLFGELIKKRPFSGWELPALIIQGFKTKFGLDIQMFRQARSMSVRHPVLYLKSSWVNARAYVSNKYAEQMYTQVRNSPGYIESEKLGWNYVGEAGYSSKRLEYYALGLTERLLTTKFKSPKLDKTVGASMRAWGKLLGASERGAVAGINNMQKGLYDQAAKNVRRLNLTPAQQKLWMKNRAKTNNTFIKILRVPPGKQYQGLRRLKQVANYLLFSPSMTVGRPLSIKALVANKGSRKYAAGVIASNIASIYAVTAIPTIIGHQMRLQNPEEEPDVNGELNVLDGNWGKIRYGEEVFDFSGGDAPFYRTLARIGVSTYMRGRGAITGKEITEVAGKRIPDAGDTLERYFTTRETAALGYAKTMLTGKDWMGEPIPRLEATVRALSPELVEATIEAGMADGLWASLATFAATTTSVGVSTYPVHAAATRSKFRDIVSQRKHGMDWDELSMSKQNRLRSEHRKQFEVLSERIRKERVQKPMSIEKIKEEELRSGKRITSMLSKPNRQWVEDISVGVNRRPKNWYLNDERYNRYQELVAQFVDERLSKVDFTEMEDKRRIARIQIIVKVAKNKALGTLRREIGR